MTHRVHNQGSTPFHNIVTSILYPTPGRFTVGSRDDVPAYKQVVDNERIRVWRLILEHGGEIVETVAGQPEQAMSFKLGEFYWKEPGSRAVKNTGTTRVELVEYELK
jgi:hypothetical protein